MARMLEAIERSGAPGAAAPALPPASLDDALQRQLTPDQQAIADAGLLEQGGVLAIPTGAGKTYLARLAIHLTLRQGLKAVMLAPTRALIRELAAAWPAEFPGRRLGHYTGEVGTDEAGENPSPSEADVLLTTPERLDLYVRALDANLPWLADLGLLVVDEAHTLAGGRRGAVLEGLITRLRAINPYLRVLGLSATLGNPHELAAWLGSRAYVSSTRPVPLHWQIRTFSKPQEKQALVLEEAASTVAAGGMVLVFVQSRPRAESLALALRDAGLPALPHHAGLSRAARDKAEALYRSGAVRVLVATPTLAMGVNLGGTRKVIVHDLQRMERGDWKDLPVSEVWQLAGRAGRPGLDDRGEVVLLAPRWNQKAARRYMEGRFEPVVSPLGDEALLAEQVLAAVGSRLALRAEQVLRVLAGTFLARGLAPEVLGRRVGGAIDRMAAAGMLERDEEGWLKATRLGRIACRYLLTPATVLAWRRLEDLAGGATLFELLLAVCASPDFSARLRVEFEDVAALQEALAREPMRLDGAEDRARVLGCRGRDLVAAVRTALALRAWTRLGDLQEAAELFGAQEHELEEARKEATRLLQALHAMLAAARPAQEQDRAAGDEPDLIEKAAVLGAMVAAGADDEMATLTLIDGVGPVLARRLAAAGVGDIEALALATPADLDAVQGVSAARAPRWIEQAGELVRAGGALRYREVCRRGAEPPGEPLAGRLPGLDYVRWQRAGALTVQAEGEGWIVIGGSEPHRVSRGAPLLQCDCLDAAKGRLCKHRIAVLVREEGHPGIPGFDAPQGWGENEGAGFDLAELWTKGMRP